jgi:hypothetical protein
MVVMIGGQAAVTRVRRPTWRCGRLGLHSGVSSALLPCVLLHAAHPRRIDVANKTVATRR